jgi:hypothetical protein
MWVCRLCILLVAVHTCDVQAFDHNPLDRLLQRVVDAEGQVDYESAKSDVDLISYVKLLAQISPDTHPNYFPQRADSFAYPGSYRT